MYNFVVLFLGQLLSLLRHEDSSIITSTRVGPARPLGGVSFDIFLKVALLDYVLYLIFK